MSAWALRGAGTAYLPPGFQRSIVIMHPHTAHRPDRGADAVPFGGRSSEEGSPSPAQQAVVRSLLLAASGLAAPATAALYDGTPGVPWPPPLDEVGHRLVSHIEYAVVAGDLQELLASDWAAVSGCEWPTWLWPDDRAWFLHSDPDSAFTVIGCGNALAEQILGEPPLRAVEQIL